MVIPAGMRALHVGMGALHVGIRVLQAKSGMNDLQRQNTSNLIKVSVRVQ